MLLWKRLVPQPAEQGLRGSRAAPSLQPHLSPPCGHPEPFRGPGLPHVRAEGYPQGESPFPHLSQSRTPVQDSAEISPETHSTQASHEMSHPFISELLEDRPLCDFTLWS